MKPETGASVCTKQFTGGEYWGFRASKGKHCPHAAKMRLRRVPKWLNREPYETRADWKKQRAMVREWLSDPARRPRLSKREQQSVNIHAARDSMCGGYLKQWF